MDAIKNDEKGHTVLFEQKKVPVFQNKVYPTPEEAMRATFSSVKLVQSNLTGFCYNYNFDEDLMVYDSNYNNDQANSAFFNEHLNKVAALLHSKGLKNKKVVEIGCGKGDFVHMMRDMGADCTGFDPAYPGDDPAIVKDLFSDKYSIEADVIVLRHTLEHIAEPHAFLKQISKANNHKGHIYIEVPTIDWIIGKKAFWDVFYEHCNYFSEASLGAMFEKAETGHLFGDQYIYCYAPLAGLRDKVPQQKFTPHNSAGFTGSHDHWKKKVEQAGRSIIWGAGAKGSTFLNLLDPDRKYIECVVDINPVKQNRFIGVTGHPIVSPAQLAGKKPESVFIMNENYRKEIEATLREAGFHNVNIYTL